jgi:hypothetical protein
MLYNIVISGDCNSSNVGKINLTLSQGVAPYYISWTIPSGYSPTYASSGSYNVTGLSAGSYSLSVTDSTPYNNQNQIINFTVQSSSTVTIINVTNTTCGIDNGSITVETPNYSSYGTITLYKNGTYYAQQQNVGQIAVFQNLGVGIYYATSLNYGGCIGTSENVVLYDSSSLDFDFYVVNNPACYSTNGKIYVSGITGSTPFTYSWTGPTTGDTTQSYLTGLTTGLYTLTVTDNVGCSVSKSATITNASFLGLVTYSQVSPTCGNSDGSLTFTISGGTGPYYYLLSNSDSLVSYSNSVTFNNLSSGSYTLNVTDVALCTFNYNVVLNGPNNFSVVRQTKIDNTCGFNGGQISTDVQGGVPPYTFILTSNSGYTQTITTSNNSYIFTQLSSTTYDLQISDSSNLCTYNNEITINNNVPFEISLTGNSTYCYNSEGSIDVEITNETIVSGVTNNYTYTLSNGFTSPPTTATTYSFTNLPQGGYGVTVFNQNYCSQYGSVFVDGLSPINFILYSTGCLDGSGGTSSAIILDDGPFTFNWSSNVNGQTGVYVSGLTAGTYTLTLSSETGCVTTRTTTVDCTPTIQTSSEIVISGGTGTLSQQILTFQNMLITGFGDLTLGHNYCVLDLATFKVTVDIDGTQYTTPFYTTTSFDNYPTTTGYATSLQSLIETIPYINSVYVDPVTNTLSIESEIIGGIEYYRDDSIIITNTIEYDISCLT